MSGEIGLLDLPFVAGWLRHVIDKLCPDRFAGRSSHGYKKLLLFSQVLQLSGIEPRLIPL